MTDSLINSLERYMLLGDNINRFCSKRIILTEPINREQKPNIVAQIDSNKSPNCIYKPNEIDNLFWCFYYIVQGDKDFFIDTSFKTEKAFKIECVEKLKKIKAELKSLKISLPEVENELVNEKKIGYVTLVALALLFKKNIFFVKKRYYFEYINNSEESINFIIEDKNKFFISDNKNENYMRQHYLCITNLQKPIKAVTSYSKTELENIASKLDIHLKEGCLKKDLYQAIIEYM